LRGITPEAGAGVALELERHAGLERVEVEAHRQIHEHDVVLRDVEVVHHHHVRDLDRLELLQFAVAPMRM
jgi:hypothetical protein